jgi:ATP-dependent helicase/nuclease subunit B
MIDRVDRAAFEEFRGLMVIDYKTARLPSRADIVSGRNLQLPLYAAAASAMLGGACLGGVFERIGPSNAARQRLFAAMSKHRGKYKSDNEYEDDLRTAIEHVGQFVQAMRTGRFDLLPTHQCPSYCPFRQICHFSRARHDLKAGDREGPK